MHSSIHHRSFTSNFILDLARLPDLSTNESTSINGSLERESPVPSGTTSQVVRNHMRKGVRSLGVVSEGGMMYHCGSHCRIGGTPFRPLKGRPVSAWQGRTSPFRPRDVNGMGKVRCAACSSH